MPANRGLGSSDWSPRPDFTPHRQVVPLIEDQQYSFYNDEDVKNCLLETDPQIDAYRWVLSGDEVDALALESAQNIINQRRELLLARQLEFARAVRKSGQTAVVASIVQDLETGETTVYANEVPMGRAFG